MTAIGTAITFAAIAAAFMAAGAAASAGPRFVDRGPDQDFVHVYQGGWEHFVGGGVAAFDCDADAYPDLYVAGGSAPARLLVNETAAPGAPLRFRDATEPTVGLTGVTGAYPLDIDGDGTLDLFVLRAGANAILRGLGGCRFERAEARFGFEGGDGWSVAFSAVWEPGRRLPTLAVGNYVDRDDPDGPFMACDAHELHRPSGGRYGPPLRIEPGHCALSMLFSDWGRTGRRDLRISNDRHYYVRGGSEQMLRLDDPPRFLGAADGWREMSIWGMGIASRDLDDDGLPEIVLTSMGDQKLLVLEGDGRRPSYAVAPYARGATAHRPYAGGDGRPSSGWHAAFGDADNDGRDDLFIAKGNVDQMPDMAMEDPDNLLMQLPDGRFEEQGAAAGVGSTARGRGAAFVDLNLDGRLDIAVVNRRAPMLLWENRTPDAGRWLGVALRQPGPNAFAAGARIELRTGDRLRVRETTIGGGHAGGDALPAHFGLGAAEAAELRIVWPDGARSAWKRAQAGRTAVVSRISKDGAATLRPLVPGR